MKSQNHFKTMGHIWKICRSVSFMHVAERFSLIRKFITTLLKMYHFNLGKEPEFRKQQNNSL